MINEEMSNAAIRKALGERVQAQRLQRNQDQESFAYEAGISNSTLYRLESGGSVSFEAILKVLRVLDMLYRLDELVPKAELSPIQRAKEKKPALRKRATGSRKKAKAQSNSAQDKDGWQGFKQQVHFED